MGNAVLSVSFCLLALLAQGCAVGNRYNFTGSIPELNLSGPRESAVAVATLDRRTTVVTGESAPTYVGMQRGGFGNVFRVDTESGLPFADDVTRAVSDSLARKGFSATPVYVTFDKTEAAAVQALLDRKSRRSLFLLVNRWESDTYANIGLEYDLRLKVMDLDRNVLANASTAGKETIPGSAWNPPAAAMEQIPIAFKRVLETLLNDPKVLDALK
ncbi:MAG: hypothetical protein H6Q84_1474 [Deltaproteobacteria bacterium]|nr:hypothetical protein [Deltaproteobacteria bacterium]